MLKQSHPPVPVRMQNKGGSQGDGLRQGRTQPQTAVGWLQKSARSRTSRVVAAAMMPPPARMETARLQAVPDTSIPHSATSLSLHWKIRLSRGTDLAPGHKKRSRSVLSDRLLEERQLPTLPPGGAVPSALAGLTSLFGMGRGGSPPL